MGLENVDWQKKKNETAMHSFEECTAQDAESYLHERSISRLNIEAWKPFQPIVYVLPDKVRHGKAFDAFDDQDIPNLVYLHAPTGIDRTGEELVPEGYPAVYGLLNEQEARTDYYVLERGSNALRLVKSSTTARTHKNPYAVLKTNLYDGTSFIPGEDA